MTAAVLRLPVTQEAADRMAMQARREAIRTACLDVLAHHEWHTREAIEDAWVNLALYGDEHEREVARAKVDEMVEESAADVVAKMAPQWPQITLWAAVIAVAMLAATGWL